jgi:molybdopterin-guanine dinucleotide biosynthesis protein A
MTDLISMVVQAGGNSRRMSEDKGRKLFLGRPLIQRVVDRVAPIASEVFVTTNQPADYAFLNMRLVPDLIPGHGALGGIYTALSSASYPVVAVVACDMPFASADLFRAAINVIVREEWDVVIPKSTSGVEPLHAVYRRLTCLPFVKAAIDSNRLKIIDWFSSVRVRELSLDEVAGVDPSPLIFQNVNTPEEFLEAELLAKSGQD